MTYAKPTVARRKLVGSMKPSRSFCDQQPTHPDCPLG